MTAFGGRALRVDAQGRVIELDTQLSPAPFLQSVPAITIMIEEDVLSGGGEMGALMRRLDWSNTPVGSVASWPQSLRTAISIILASRFPMYIAWGREFCQFYNDGYRPILGSTKHPAAMGRSTRKRWPRRGSEGSRSSCSEQRVTSGR